MIKKQDEAGKTNLVESVSQEESSSNHIVNNSPDSGSVVQDKEQSSNEKTESLKDQIQQILCGTV